MLSRLYAEHSFCDEKPYAMRWSTLYLEHIAPRIPASLCGLGSYVPKSCNGLGFLSKTESTVDEPYCTRTYSRGSPGAIETVDLEENKTRFSLKKGSSVSSSHSMTQTT
jgi:hypothetical protein